MVASSRRLVRLGLVFIAAELVVGAGCSRGHVAGGGEVSCDAAKPNFGCGVGSQCIDQQCVAVAAGCSDRLQDGVETGVDCGGSCQSCASRCADRVRDGDEAGVDCGGTCGACTTGSSCAAGTDCASGACANNTCLAAATCTDGVRDGSETAVDCGGSCPGCADGLGCVANADCQHGVCSDGLCRAATCSNGALDGFETGIDCGGGLCPACAGGVGCIFASDCTSGVCAAGVCQPASCSDGVKNGAETGTDCGGTCGTCANGEGCALDSECQSGACVRGVCAAPDCTTACGGSCPACPVGGACTDGVQCESGVCVAGSCRAATCTDGVANGDETGTDCGGGTCGACANGGGCAVGSDCQSGLCAPSTHVCQAAAGGVASLSVVVSPAPAYSCKPSTLVVVALDASGNIVREYTGKVHFTSSDASAVLPADYTFVAGDQGVHRFVDGVTLFTLGAQSVTATDSAASGVTGSTSGVEVRGAAVASLQVSGIPASVVAGAASTVTVAAYDSCGQLATGYAGMVQFASSDPLALPGTGLPASYTFKPADAGTHAFVGEVTLATAGTQTVTVEDVADPAISGAQSGIVVTPAAATALQVNGITSPLADCSASTITVAALDAYGNTDPSYAGTVTFTSTDTQASLPLDYTFTGVGGDAGVHTFTGQVVLRAVGTQTITATDTVTGSIKGTSRSIDVVAGPAVALALLVTTTPPSSNPTVTVAGVAGDLTVTAKDACGAVAVDYTGAVGFVSSDGNAVLPAGYTFVAADHGAHVFSGGMVLKTVGSQSVTVTDATDPTITAKQMNIQVRPAAAATLEVSGIISPIGPSTLSTLTVRALDAFGNQATGYTGTIAFTSTDPAATLPGAYTFVAGDNGSHSFASGVVLQTVGIQSVTATDTGTPSITGAQTGIDVSANGCGQRTCASTNTQCGPVGDGCGGIIQCGGCSATASCSKCQDPKTSGSCTPGQSCGTCTGSQVCQTCSVPESCTSGACGATSCCIPISQCPAGLNCGLVPDGCGGFFDCGSCSVVGETCTANVCGSGACIPETTCTAGTDCGQQSDHCGGVVNCCASPPCAAPGTCSTGTCGGGGTANVCGEPACVPMTCADAGATCGPIGDGCGGVLNCGTCTAPQSCGGGGTPSQCGCTGLVCWQVACSGSASTVVSGEVYAATPPDYWPTGGGPDPLFNALVYVPNAPLAPFTSGVTCSQCSAQVSGDPLMWANTTTQGSFSLTNVPAGTDVPLVIQFGYWRREVFIPKITACTTNVLPGPSACAAFSDQTSCRNANCAWNTAVTPSCETLTRLPRTRAEGAMPQIAIASGAADAVECVLPKIGIDPSEFTPPGHGGRVNFFQDTGGSGDGAILGDWTCGGGGAGVCGTGTCTPKTQVQACAGLSCGYASDGCGGSFSCGTCTAPQTCGGGGTPGACGGPSCTPATCASLGFNCGRTGTGCGFGSLSSCGTCSGGTPYCGGGGRGICGSTACTPSRSCSALGLNCGYTDNGCGTRLNCGSSCPAGQTCGGGGTPNVCGTLCTPTKSCESQGLECGYTDDGCGRLLNCGSSVCTPPASDLYDSLATLQQYNIVIWDCVGSQVNKTAAQKKNIMDYVNSGGRMFATHFGYVWLYDNPPFGCTTPVGCTGSNCTVCATPGQTTAYWRPQRSAPPNQAACLTTDPALNPEGSNFADWLYNVGSSGSSTGNSCAPQPFMDVQVLRWDANLTGPAGEAWPATSQLWAYTKSTINGTTWNTPVEFTFNTPVNAAPANQCGRVLFSDFHVYNSPGGSPPYTFPTPDCTVGPLSPQEKILEYMIFDLSNCVSTNPGCVPGTCPANSCGPIADGCGGLMNGGNCGTCATGQTCGGGGVPSQCGTPGACVPLSQSAACGSAVCGYASDGCGTVLSCGACLGGQVCNNGACAASCTPLTNCPAGTNCGTMSDGCGGYVTCGGTCTPPETCGGSGTPNVCAVPCTPTTCQAAGANCGQIGDGCGGALNCGTCLAPAVCGGSGTPNVCSAPCSTSTCAVDADCCTPLRCSFGSCLSQ